MRRVLAANGQKAARHASRCWSSTSAHPLVRYMDGVRRAAEFGELAQLLYDQAALAEEGQIGNPADYVRRLNQLLVRLAGMPSAAHERTPRPSA